MKNDRDFRLQRPRKPPKNDKFRAENFARCWFVQRPNPVTIFKLNVTSNGKGMETTWIGLVVKIYISPKFFFLFLEDNYSSPNLKRACKHLAASREISISTNLNGIGNRAGEKNREV